ncbi:hypothetical protein DFJ58DRAFT_735047 [Suillus subalutaceus]|uniref:uncharacterized protein n=1 Tax=Suillus subalutaceus TaxID=48586 RepID=UPI001B884C9E|nr:uncharacterized protein DFJ58DRAFT_735047 [Suillus subalutaceus]KAG1836316.1 hypothetical protein DFJ58DRAFT_735047 [Suillus subalutaceus]
MILNYVPLNEFEVYCKENWDIQPEAGGMPLEPPIFDSPFDLIQDAVYFIPSTQDLQPQSSAIVGGHEANGDPLYIVRAPYEGGIYPGKASPKESVYISHDGREINIHGKFERLVGDQSCVRWAHVDGRFYYGRLGGAIPVRGGTEPPGAALYIAQASVEGGVHCGKVKFDSYAAIPLNGSEIIAESYNVLVFCD